MYDLSLICNCDTYAVSLTLSFHQAIFATFNLKKKKKNEIDGDGDDDENEGGDDESDAEQDLEEEEESEEEDLEEDDDEPDRATDDESDDGEVDEDREECDEREMEEIRDLVEEELNLNHRVLKGPHLAIQRIKLIARRTHFSSTRRRALRQYCVQKKVPEKIIPRAVVTRWTSLTNTITVALQIRPAIALLTENPKHKLTPLALDEEQWTFLGHLYPIIDVSTLIFWLCNHIDFDPCLSNSMWLSYISKLVIGHSFMKSFLEWTTSSLSSRTRPAMKAFPSQSVLLPLMG